MSTVLEQFKLTEYTDLRTLELQLCKLQDENQLLKGRLAKVEQMNKNTYATLHQDQLNLQHKISTLDAQSHQEQLFATEVVGAVGRMAEELVKLDSMGIDIGIDVNQIRQIGKEEVPNWLQTFWNGYLSLINKNSDLSLKCQRELQLCREGERLYRKQEQQLRQQLLYMSQQLQKQEKINHSLSNQLNLTKRQNKDYKMQLYEIDRSQQPSESKLYDGTIEDNNFTVDLLHYQKELLQGIFQRLLSTVQQEDIAGALIDLYEGYERVGDTFREKLQIQYDLEDLQREYKRDKNSSVGEKLLIQLRKQIQDFRKELHKQKDLLVKDQQELEQCFIGLAAAEKQQKQVRSHTISIQKKLASLRQKKEGQGLETVSKVSKSNWEESRMQSGSRVQGQLGSRVQGSRIKFKASGTTEEMMREVVRQDRQNIEKLFKETRQTYLKT